MCVSALALLLPPSRKLRQGHRAALRKPLVSGIYVSLKGGGLAIRAGSYSNSSSMDTYALLEIISIVLGVIGVILATAMQVSGLKGLPTFFCALSRLVN